MDLNTSKPWRRTKDCIFGAILVGLMGAHLPAAGDVVPVQLKVGLLVISEFDDATPEELGAFRSALEEGLADALNPAQVDLVAPQMCWICSTTSCAAIWTTFGVCAS